MSSERAGIILPFGDVATPEQGTREMKITFYGAPGFKGHSETRALKEGQSFSLEEVGLGQVSSVRIDGAKPDVVVEMLIQMTEEKGGGSETMKAMQKRNPQSGLPDADMLWDFLTLTPESVNAVTYLFSDPASPNG